MDKRDSLAWHERLKAGDEEDIIKWPSGEWQFRHNFQDTDEEDGFVPEQLRGRAYEVIVKGSSEWARLQQAKKIRAGQSQLGVSSFYYPPRQFTDEFIEGLAASARESSKVGDGARVMQLARELYRASRSSHATGDAQRARAAKLHKEVLSQVDLNVVLDDRYRVLRASSMTDYAEAVALLEHVTDPNWVSHAQALIVSKKRERDGRSVSNMRRIGDLEHHPIGGLRQERVHARALIMEARKTGNREQATAACQQLYRIGVALVLAWDAHMRSYHMSKKNRDKMDHAIRKLFDTIDEVDWHIHGQPAYEREDCQLTELSKRDLGWIAEYLGQTTKKFIPVKHLQDGGSWDIPKPQ